MCNCDLLSGEHPPHPGPTAGNSAASAVTGFPSVDWCLRFGWGGSPAENFFKVFGKNDLWYYVPVKPHSSLVHIGSDSPGDELDKAGRYSIQHEFSVGQYFGQSGGTWERDSGYFKAYNMPTGP